MNNLESRSIDEQVRRLRQESSTPLCAYIYTLDALREHVSRTVASLPPGVRFFYSVQANSQAPVLRALAPYVHGFSATSPGEIEKVRAVATEAQVVYHAPSRTEADVDAAILQGVLRFNAESAAELHRLSAVAVRRNVTLKVLLRATLNGPFPAAAVDSIPGAPTQFGVDEDDVPDVSRLATHLPNLDLEGFHFHDISNQLNPHAHVDVLRMYIRRAKMWTGSLGRPLRTLNVGGGIGVRYDDPSRPFDWPTFVAKLDLFMREEQCPPDMLHFECGRYLVAGSAVYATEVLDVKRNQGRAFAIVRGGSHHFGLPAITLTPHAYSIVRFDAWDAPYERPSIRNVPLTIVGQLPTVRDTLTRDRKIDEIRVGDVVVFELAGAYGWESSPHDFGGYAPPQHVFLQAV